MERLNKNQGEFCCTATYVEFDEFARKKKKIKFIMSDLLFTSCALRNRQKVFVVHNVDFNLA